MGGSFLLILCVSLILVANGALIDDIKAANGKFMAAFAAKNLTAVSNLYTTDCKLMLAGSDVMTGRDAVSKTLGDIIGSGVKTVKLDIDEVGPLENATDLTMAFERSHYTFLKEDNEVFDNGKYVVIWKQIKGEWFLYIDIISTDLSL